MAEGEASGPSHEAHAQSPSLPAFPSFSDLSSLSQSLDAVTSNNNNDDDESPSAVWGSAASVTVPVLVPTRSRSRSPRPPPSSSSSAVESAIATQAHAASYSLDDLDPYASNPFADQQSLGLGPQYTPSKIHTTLGERVTPNSRLELLSDSEPSSSPSPSPTSSFNAPLPTPPASEKPPKVTDRPSVPLGHGSTPSGSGSSFFGGMFRSFSGSPSGGPQPTAAEQEKANLQREFNEKAPLPPIPTSSDPVASTSSAAPPPPSSQQSSIPNPIASIASVFRSATSSKPSSQAGTPPAGSSPAQGEKGAYMEAGRRAKEKEKAKDPEKAAEQQQQEGAGSGEAVFDFNKFLEQMRSRSADPIAKYLRSFLKEFSRKPPASTNDQIKVINDFLDFIAGKMRTVDPWKSVVAEHSVERGEAEFDMAMEAMEKLVMNRLWHLTFAPAVDLNNIPGHMPPSDDLERDHVLTQRIRLFAWIKPFHLDLPINPPPSLPTSPNPNISLTSPLSSPALSSDGSDTEGGEEKKSMSIRKQQKQTQGFLDFAQKELAKINQYKAPRDKLICVLNSCKVIFGLIRHVSSDEGADSFIPFLIYVVLKSNPEHLVSNLQYIQRFRNPEKLSGEGGYYLSSLNGAISFIETMDASSLSNITQDEFEHNVELAIQRLPVDPQDSTLRLPRTPTKTTFSSHNAPEPPHSTAADLTQATDTDSPALIQQPGLSLPNATKAFFIRSSDSVERIVSKPLGAIARVFDQIDQQLTGDGDASPNRLPVPPMVNGVPQMPHDQQPPPGGVPVRRRSYQPYRSGQNRPPPLDLQSAAARGGNPSATQSPSPAPTDAHSGLYISDRMSHMSPSQVAEEIERVTEEKRLASIETLRSIFPQLESEVLEMVLLSNSGEMGTTVEALLEMSTPT